MKPLIEVTGIPSFSLSILSFFRATISLFRVSLALSFSPKRREVVSKKQGKGFWGERQTDYPISSFSNSLYLFKLFDWPAIALQIVFLVFFFFLWTHDVIKIVFIFSHPFFLDDFELGGKKRRNEELDLLRVLVRRYLFKIEQKRTTDKRLQHKKGKKKPYYPPILFYCVNNAFTLHNTTIVCFDVKYIPPLFSPTRNPKSVLKFSRQFLCLGERDERSRTVIQSLEEKRKNLKNGLFFSSFFDPPPLVHKNKLAFLPNKWNSPRFCSSLFLLFIVFMLFFLYLENKMQIEQSFFVFQPKYILSIKWGFDE